MVDAVGHYSDIPPEVRARLQERMARRDYDEIVDIRRDSISGKDSYDSQIREMHFGAGSICRTVTRSNWTNEMHERGLVYCESGQCILVPTVCRNVSRIVRDDLAKTAAAAEVIEPPVDTDLLFEPPAAGAVPSVVPAAPTTFAIPPVPIPGWLGVPIPNGGGQTGVTPAIPEPETWMSFLAGLGVLGLLKLRRRSRTR